VRVVADLVAAALGEIERGRSPAFTIANHLRAALSADTSSYGWLDTPSGTAELRTWPDIIDMGLMLRASGTMPHAHPVLGHWLDGHTDAAVVSSLVTDWSRWRNSEAYALLKRGVGCTETGGIRLKDRDHTIRMIGVARERDFTDEEVELIHAVRVPAIALCAHADWLGVLDEKGLRRSGALGAAVDVGLTTREFQVIQLLASGLLASSIGARMSISTRTVHRHLSHIYSKLGTHDRLTTVMVAQRSGLLPGRTNYAPPST
jgi:DNA-binding CsgD family transcriptional regulator